MALINGVAPIANKLGTFLVNPNVRKALSNPEQTLRFRKLMDEGTPLIINLSKGKHGADLSNVLGGLIVSMFGNAAYTRVNIQEQRRRPYHLYVDEFHSFTTDAFASALAEFRKYRLALVMASQTTTQYSAKVLESILGNVGTLICFRVGAKDAPIISKQLGWYASKPDFIQTAYLSSLPSYNFYIRLKVQGAVSKVYSAITLRKNI